MIPNYIQPQVRIKQELEEANQTLSDRMAAIVIGPQYSVVKAAYGSLPETAYAGSGVDLPYAGPDGVKPSTYPVDESSVAVLVKNGKVLLASFSATGSLPKINIASATDPSLIRLDSGNFSGGSLDNRLHGRSVVVGDQVRVTSASGTVIRTVTSLVGAPTASSYGSDSGASNGQVADGPLNPITFDPGGAAFYQVSAPSGKTILVEDETDYAPNEKGGILNNKAGDRFTLTVLTGGAPGVATVSISSLSGKWFAASAATVNSGGDYLVNNAALAGLTVRIIAPTLVAGEQYVFDIYQPYTRLTSISGAVTLAGTYSGSYDTTFVVQVVQGNSGNTFTGAKINIFDSANIFPAQMDVAVTDNVPISIGGGLTIKFHSINGTGSQKGLRAGDVYTFFVKAAGTSTVDFNGLRLSGPAVTGLSSLDATENLEVEFLLPYNGYLSKKTNGADNWSPAEDGTKVTITGNAVVKVDGRNPGYEWCPLIEGGLSVEYRALVPKGASESYFLVDSASELDQFGLDVPENNLRFALSEALRGSNGKPVYALRVPEDSAEGLENALKVIEQVDDFMFMAPVMTDNVACINVLNTHINLCSNEENLNFRRAYIGVDSPGERVVASGSASITSLNGEYKLATLSGFTVESVGLKAGDILRFPLHGDKEIAAVISNTEVMLADAFENAISPAISCFAVLPANPANIEAYISNLGATGANRRYSIVWCNAGRNVYGQVIANRYAAARIAGMRSANPPQKGLTRQPIGTFASAPSMYTMFSKAALNRIAANGVFIISQNGPGLPVLIRHQLTTDTDSGPLYYEDNVGIILDVLSFRWKDALDPYIGKRNVSALTISDIREELSNILIEASSVGASEREIGPMIQAFSPVQVHVHPTLKNWITAEAEVEIATPLHVVKGIIRGRTISSLGQ